MSGTVGTTASGSLYYYSTGAMYQVACKYTMPSPGGLIKDIACQFDGYLSSPSAYLVIWDNSGAVLAHTNAFTLNNKGATDALDWWKSGSGSVSALNAEPFVAAGANIWIGIACMGNFILSCQGTSDGAIYGNKPGSVPSSFTGTSSFGSGVVGDFGSYADWIEAGCSAWDGVSSFQECTVESWDGSAWQVCTAESWDGSAWQYTS